ncbi:hypothetical protein D9M70_442170 [compost metagenome]
MLEIPDEVLVLLDQFLEDIIIGQDPDDPPGLDDRQVPDPPGVHQRQALLAGVVGCDVNYLRGHDVADPGAACRAAGQLNLSGVVSLGKDAGEAAGLHHEYRADVLVRHQAQRGQYRVVGADGDQLAGLPGQ